MLFSSHVKFLFQKHCSGIALGIALNLESTSLSLAFPERQVKLRYLFGQVDRFETSIPNQKRGFNHVDIRVCYFTVCVQGSCYSIEVNLYTLMPIDS